jgi:hypothetical protein
MPKPLFWISKPKTPGFGISKQFYLTVLAAKATLPTLVELINPKGEQGGVKGFGVPLSSGASKDTLTQPMSRGAYALATIDRKTVIRCLVVSKEEAGFDPDAFALSAEAIQAEPELVARIRGAWTLVQMGFESHDPMVKPALDFMVELCARLGKLTDGSIADPIGQRYFLPEELDEVAQDKIDALFHVSIRTRQEQQGIRAFTLGMQKFGLAEFEVAELQEADLKAAEAFLYSLCQSELNGRLAEVGDKVGAKRQPFQVCEGGHSRDLWEGIACYELVPNTGVTAGETLRSWLEESQR